MYCGLIKYINNEKHYALLMEQINKVKHTLWIGTADLKDLYVRPSSTVVPLLQLLEMKVKQKVAIRLIHAKEPGTNFRADFDKYPLLWTGVERVLCPRVHFKILVFDMQSVYIGSANMTGAAFGMKSTKTRNFEAGILRRFPNWWRVQWSSLMKFGWGNIARDVGGSCFVEIRWFDDIKGNN